MSARDLDKLKMVKRHAEHVRDEIEHRDGWIRLAYSAGYSLREIAEVAGLSHAGIAKIVKRDD